MLTAWIGPVQSFWLAIIELPRLSNLEQGGYAGSYTSTLLCPILFSIGCIAWSGWRAYCQVKTFHQ